MNKIRTVVYGRPQTRPRILELLQPHADIELSMATAGLQVLWHGVQHYDPHVVLAETHRELTETVGLVTQIQLYHPAIKCIVLAHRLDMDHVRRAVDVGAMGYLLIEPAIDDLVTPVRLVHSGNFTCSPEIARLLTSPA